MNRAPARRGSKQLELELKYSIDDPRDVERWVDATFPPSDGERWRTVPIIDRYFDTPDAALAAAAVGARLRTIRKQTTLTVKRDVQVAGPAHERVELEGPADDLLDPAQWPPSEARSSVEEIRGDRRLIERFTVRQRRRERTLIFRGATLLASIDTGTVEAAGVAAGSIAQLEVELVRGRRAALERIAQLIETGAIGAPEPRSKLVIAAELTDAASRVSPDDMFAEAGRKILRRHLLRLLERERPTLAGDPVAVKQMRVATRRLRATWRAFGDVYRSRVRSRFARGLRRTGRALGAVRDLDVLLEGLPDEPALLPLRDHWVARRAAALGELTSALRSARYARLIDGLIEFTSTPGAGVRRRSSMTVREAAPAAVHAAYQRLLEAGAAADTEADLDAWHALRIEGRRFRYSLEAFRDVLDPDDLAPLLRQVIRLQDHLGALNDASVASRAISDWLAHDGADAPAESRDAAAVLVTRRELEIDELRSSLAAVWQQIVAPEFVAEIAI